MSEPILPISHLEIPFLSFFLFFSHSTPFLPYVRAHSSHISPFLFFFSLRESLGKAGEMPGEMIAREVRPLVCAHTISACTLSELEILRADETARDEIDEEIDEEIDVEIDEEIDEEIDGEADGEGDGEGDEERRPPVKIESERPIMHQPGPLVRLVAADFHTRVVEEGRERFESHLRPSQMKPPNNANPNPNPKPNPP